MKVTLLVPVLNEEVGMREIMPTVDRSLFCQILIVDGHSTDKTVAIAKEMGFDVVTQVLPGVRGAYLAAWPHIKGDAVITFSPDGNSLVECLKPCIEKFKEGYDLVLVSRYKDEAKSEDDDVVTGFGNWLFTNSINFFHRGRYTDAMGIYRMYRTNLPHELDLEKPESYAFEEKLFGTNVSWEPLMSIRAAKRAAQGKLKIAEIPGDEPKRIGGVRKLQILRWGASFYWEILREVFFWR
ncbi:MAG: glycosyltransferase [Candidatus Omnitrophica bacterium]|nr:glycosyltransferase [Candidatus Omnitrophota bacterium]